MMGEVGGEGIRGERMEGDNEESEIGTRHTRWESRGWGVGRGWGRGGGGLE